MHMNGDELADFSMVKDTPRTGGFVLKMLRSLSYPFGKPKSSIQKVKYAKPMARIHTCFMAKPNSRPHNEAELAKR